MTGEKTEKATPHKRMEARKKGQVARSNEVSTAVTLLLSFFCLWIGGKSFVEGCLSIFRTSYQEYLLLDTTMYNLQTVFKQILIESAKLVAPIFAVTVAAGIISNVAQVGFMLNGLKMDFSKIDPIKGAKNIISLRAIVELLKSIFKIGITSIVSFIVIWGKKADLIMIGQKSIWEASILIGTLIIQLGIVVSATLIIVAIADYAYQKFSFEKNLRMSKQEIKEEYKKMDGDPFIKSKRKARQREIAMKRMMQEVPKADVIITNPTHFAIAIQYDFKSMDAPKVIAKGKDHIALKIKEIAKQNKIMTVENKPLARTLYAEVEIGEFVPEELFNAVGEILAYVFYQNGKYKGMMK